MKIAVLGLAFKPNTDDMRDSPSLTIIPALTRAGAEIAAYDPAAMAEARKLLSGITYCDDAYAPLQNADALVIITEWNQFRALDLARVKSLMRAAVMIDLRNVYGRADAEKYGFRYVGVGKGA
jgi:UDPglucose 6-dehydrogenase